MMDHLQTVSLVLPVFNNAKSLKELHQQLVSQLSLLTLPYELIFVNDASTDNSMDILQELSRADSNIEVIENEANYGQNRSLMFGIARAKGDLIVVMDADLQDSPDYLPELLTELKDNVEAVFLLREGSYQAKDRMLSSRLFKTLIQWLTGLPNRAGSYYVITRGLADKMLKVPVRFPVLTIMVYNLSRKTSYIKGKRNHNQGQSSYSSYKRLIYAYKAIHCALTCGRIKVK